MSDMNEKATVELVETNHVDNIDPYASTKVSMWQSIRESPKVLLYSVLMTFGPMAFGFDSIIVGVVTAIPAFLQTYGEPFGDMYILPSLWLALWNAFIQIGFMIGSIINGPVADRFGRKAAMAAGAAIAAIAIAVIYVSDRSTSVNHRRGVFLAGKTVLGIGLSMMMSTCQTYNSEIAPPKLRGPLLSIFQFFLVLGQLIAAVVAQSQIVVGFTPRSYQICFATQWAFAGLAFIVALVVPESPAFLLRRENVQGARKSFARLHSISTVEGSIAAMQTIMEHEKQFESLNHGATYLECFKGSNWRRTRIIIYASILQQFLGITLVANGTYFMIVAGLSPANSILVLEIALGLALAANITSWVLASTLGRRRTLIGCAVWLGLIWTSVGIAGCFKSKAALWYMGVVINLVLFFYGIGAGGISPIVSAETSSIRLRAKSNSIGFFCNGFMSWAFNFFTPYMFNADQANWGGKTGFFFAALSLLAGVALFFEIPEMKNRTYMQLDEMFEDRIKTRAFARHQTRGELAHGS